MKTLEEMDGMYIELLNSQELAIFYTAVREGKADKEYQSNILGRLGIGKVRLIKEEGE